jgi:hypothetical protein
MRNPFLPALIVAVLVGCALAQTPPSTAQAVPPTEISADLGGCSALITVVGADAKPVYNAKIATRIRYGVFGAKKLDLEVFTSAAGQVKIVGLPESVKKPLLFDVSKGAKLATVEFRPAEECRASLKVQLK